MPRYIFLMSAIHREQERTIMVVLHLRTLVIIILLHSLDKVLFVRIKNLKQSSSVSLANSK